jgi:bacterioferritin (cytochrome b1)
MAPADPDREQMDERRMVDALNRALVLQLRAPLSYSHVAASLLGVHLHGLRDELAGFAHAELDDARRLLEKVVTLGGEATVDVAPLERFDDAADAIRWLVESETAAIEALHECIPATGEEGRSEALEHRLEHTIMRKQEQVDTLIRAMGDPEGQVRPRS